MVEADELAELDAVVEADELTDSVPDEAEELAELDAVVLAEVEAVVDAVVLAEVEAVVDAVVLAEVETDSIGLSTPDVVHPPLLTATVMESPPTSWSLSSTAIRSEADGSWV